jgi:hypothetical protein
LTFVRVHVHHGSQQRGCRKSVLLASFRLPD